MSNGFVKYSYAPFCNEATVVSRSEKAVIIIIGMCGYSLLSLSTRSIPLIPGILTSESMMSGLIFSKFFRILSASSKDETLKFSF